MFFFVSILTVKKQIHNTKYSQNYIWFLFFVGILKETHSDKGFKNVFYSHPGLSSNIYFYHPLRVCLLSTKIFTKFSQVGTVVLVGKIDGHQKRIGAIVIAFPFYDPTKSRVRA